LARDRDDEAAIGPLGLQVLDLGELLLGDDARLTLALDALLRGRELRFRVLELGRLARGLPAARLLEIGERGLFLLGRPRRPRLGARGDRAAAGDVREVARRRIVAVLGELTFGDVERVPRVGHVTRYERGAGRARRALVGGAGIVELARHRVRAAESRDAER